MYHLLGARAFSVNLPTTATNTPTLLNSVIPTHPGVAVQATFGATGVTAATVKGAANATASNILINPLPGATSDQNYINGVLHKIDQVLRTTIKVNTTLFTKKAVPAKLRRLFL